MELWRRQGGLLMYCEWSLYTLCILVALTEGDCMWIYGVVVWGDLFEELMLYALLLLSCFLSIPFI